jgi:hypothetical protein
MNRTFGNVYEDEENLSDFATTNSPKLPEGFAVSP